MFSICLCLGFVCLVLCFFAWCGPWSPLCAFVVVAGGDIMLGTCLFVFHCFAPGSVRVYLSAEASRPAYCGWSLRGKVEDGLAARVEPPYCKSSDVVLEGAMPPQGTGFLSFFPEVIEFELSIWDFLFLGKDRASRSWIARTQ